MFGTVRFLSLRKFNRILQLRVLSQQSVKKSCNSSPKKNGISFKGLSKNILYGQALQFNRRHFSDKFTEKGRGDELNYFLKLGNEQFIKLRKNRIQEITNSIEALENEVKKLEKQTSRRAMKLKENLLKEINDLKEMLERFKDTLEKENKE
ncbi:uncharacterized protein LOC108053772 isoform X2 [Drosophila rhopaloa]|uniref:Uncharacterized protein LOC108053772 isoform X2 n=1 Tax=Drosophila rhopaloa TaxID=1041015 RepID=A0A6P4FRA7_DRORH|nr:uncharacterized protein LOC108053772 isoform X2 [Drosophila rhopaloa]